jgi:hypothetical protein
VDAFQTDADGAGQQYRDKGIVFLSAGFENAWHLLICTSTASRLFL